MVGQSSIVIYILFLIFEIFFSNSAPLIISKSLLSNAGIDNKSNADIGSQVHLGFIHVNIHTHAKNVHCKKVLLEI